MTESCVLIIVSCSSWAKFHFIIAIGGKILRFDEGREAGSSPTSCIDVKVPRISCCIRGCARRQADSDTSRRGIIYLDADERRSRRIMEMLSLT